MATLAAVDYLKTVARIAARELRRRNGTPASRARLVVERWGLRAEPRRLAAYLRATGGDRIPQLCGPDALLPPLYPAVWETQLALELLARPQAPSIRGGVVHLESELLLVRPLRAHDSARCRLELERIEPEPHGRVLTLAARTWNATGQLCTEARTRLLARGGPAADRAPGRRERGAPETAAAAEPAWSELARWRIHSDHGRRYARASGDYNPIHLWSLTARPFGFRRPILHGHCTAALAAHALIERLCHGDASALRRLKVAFRRPLLLPAEVRLLCASTGETTRFRVVGAAERVYAEGEAAGCGRAVT